MENKLTRTEQKRSVIESRNTRKPLESTGHHKKNKGGVEKGKAREHGKEETDELPKKNIER